jgi:hypothetical protein
MKKQEYPKNFKEYKEVYGYGGIRIYEVSEDEAKSIAKQFPQKFKYKPPFAPFVEDERVFYMNINHGEQHILFTLPE